MTKSKGKLRQPRRPWTEAERDVLRARYADTKTETLAREIDRSLTATYGEARKLGLAKSAEYLASPDACRLRQGDNIGASSRFKKGQTPANKGLRRPGWSPGRMAETQFKPGVRQGIAALKWMPIGTVRRDAEGYLRIKVREGRKGEAYGFGNTKIWPLLQRHVWEEHRGPIPPSHAILFTDGDRSNCAIDNLECISRADLMRRNTIHVRYPQEMVSTIMLLGAVKRKLREKSAEEHDDRPAQPSV